MGLSPGKCGCFWVKRHRDAWTSEDPGIKLGNDYIKNFGVASPFTYLGVDFTLAKSMDSNIHVNRLKGAADRVGRLALKSHQKSTLLMQYVVPASAHRFSIDLPCGNKLKDLDRDIRNTVKRMLHLHPKTTDHLLYTRKRDGGLVFPRLLNQIRVCALRAGCALLNSTDPLLRELSQVGDWETKLRSLSTSLWMGEMFPPLARTIDKRKFELKKEEHQRWK